MQWLEQPHIKWAVPLPLLVAVAPLIWAFFRRTWRELDEEAFQYRRALHERGEVDYRPVVALVIPAGYSFNLDGTSIYLSMATLFIAQAYGVHLSLGQQLGLLGVLMITSKGAAGVTGSGFIVLASTLAALRVLPVEGVALVLGVDRFMSEARSITNLIGNAVATVVIAKSEGAFAAGGLAPVEARAA